MLDRLKAPWRNVALGVVGVLVLWFLWSVRSALNPLGVGLLFAYMLHPLVTSLERVGWSRKMAVNLIFGFTAIGGIVLSLALFAQARSLWNDVSRENGALARIDDALLDGAGGVYAWIDRWTLFDDDEPESSEGPDEETGAQDPGDLDGGPGPVPEVDPGAQTEVDPSLDPALDPAAGGEPADAEAEVAAELPVELAERQIKFQDLFNYVRTWFSEEGRLEQAGEAGLRAAGGIWAVLRNLFGSILTFAGYLVLVPIYTWFLLFELERISDFVRKYIPRGDRERFANIGNQITEMLGSFFRGRMLVCLLKGLVLAVVLSLAGFPYALLVGMVSGFLSLVPFVGPAVGYGLAFLLGLLELSLVDALWRIAIVYTVGEVIEGYVLLPRVLGDSMGLHPIVVIVSLMVFGAALGMFGMLLALPLTSAVVILANELVLPVLREMAENDGAPRSEGDEPPTRAGANAPGQAAESPS